MAAGLALVVAIGVFIVFRKLQHKKGAAEDDDWDRNESKTAQEAESLPTSRKQAEQELANLQRQ